MKNWPEFRWNEGLIAQRLAPLRYRQGKLTGRMEAFGFALRGITGLIDRSILVKDEAGGRSTSYSLADLPLLTVEKAT